jgi:excisionase family DNA binding protein
LAHLAGVLWLPVVLLAAVVFVAWLVGRVWGRHRLSRAGCWFEVRLGEEVSRAGLEAFLRTLAHGLPRPLVGGVPWVGLSVSSVEDRAACWLFVSGGLAAAQVRAALEQALGGVTVEAPSGPVLAGGGACRVACLRAVESRFLPLRVDQRVDPAGQLLAALRAQASGEGGVIQLALQAPPRSARAGARAAPRRLTADDVMTAREVAGLLHAPVSTVEDWARRGILPSIKIGRRRLYIRQNIEAVLIGRAGDIGSGDHVAQFND